MINLQCLDINAEVDQQLNRLLNQYRETPRLQGMISTYLRSLYAVTTLICDIPSKFDIETAVGDQLTILGKRLGFPRCHCVCIGTPVFGFECDGFESDFPIVGFCESGTWVDCGAFGIGTLCIADDEMYRGFLSARRYQMMQFYDTESLTDALRAIWGSTAWVVDAGHGRVVMTPGRVLTDAEKAFLKLVPRVLPVAIGIEQRFHFGTRLLGGFGNGWYGFCEDDFAPDGLPIAANDGNEFYTNDDEPLYTNALTRDAEWMCEFDVKPYGC